MWFLSARVECVGHTHQVKIVGVKNTVSWCRGGAKQVATVTPRERWKEDASQKGTFWGWGGTDMSQLNWPLEFREMSLAQTNISATLGKLVSETCCARVDQGHLVCCSFAFRYVGMFSSVHFPPFFTDCLKLNVHVWKLMLYCAAGSVCFS